VNEFNLNKAIYLLRIPRIHRLNLKPYSDFKFISVFFAIKLLDFYFVISFNIIDDTIAIKKNNYVFFFVFISLFLKKHKLQCMHDILLVSVLLLILFSKNSNNLLFFFKKIN
jgi:hypothetical protein